MATMIWDKEVVRKNCYIRWCKDVVQSDVARDQHKNEYKMNSTYWCNKRWYKGIAPNGW